MGLGRPRHPLPGRSSNSPIISEARKRRRAPSRPCAPPRASGRPARIKGQESAKRALEIAAAGGHNLLMNGAPGGQVHARPASAVDLPAADPRESLEASMVHSVAASAGGALTDRRLFRVADHRFDAGVVGGGAHAKPGEIFARSQRRAVPRRIAGLHAEALDSLRQPIETGEVAIARANHRVVTPPDFSWWRRWSLPLRLGQRARLRLPADSPTSAASRNISAAFPAADRSFRSHCRRASDFRRGPCAAAARGLARGRGEGGSGAPDRACPVSRARTRGSCANAGVPAPDRGDRGGRRTGPSPAARRRGDAAPVGPGLSSRPQARPTLAISTAAGRRGARTWPRSFLSRARRNQLPQRHEQKRAAKRYFTEFFEEISTAIEIVRSLRRLAGSGDIRWSQA